MHTTSLDLFKQVSISYCSCSLYSYVHMYSSCFKLQLQMFLKEWEKSICIYVCVWWGGRHLTVNFSSPRVQSKQIFGPLSSLSSSTFHLSGWQRKELSKAFTFWTFLAAILQTTRGREESQGGRKGGTMKSSPCFIGKRLAGRIVCLRSLPGREGL